MVSVGSSRPHIQTPVVSREHPIGFSAMMSWSHDGSTWLARQTTRSLDMSADRWMEKYSSSAKEVVNSGTLPSFETYVSMQTDYAQHLSAVQAGAWAFLYGVPNAEITTNLQGWALAGTEELRNPLSTWLIADTLHKRYGYKTTPYLNNGGSEWNDYLNIYGYETVKVPSGLLSVQTGIYHENPAQVINGATSYDGMGCDVNLKSAIDDSLVLASMIHMVSSQWPFINAVDGDSWLIFELRQMLAMHLSMAATNLRILDSNGCSFSWQNMGNFSDLRSTAGDREKPRQVIVTMNAGFFPLQ
jgi:hypothetical protein